MSYLNRLLCDIVAEATKAVPISDNAKKASWSSACRYLIPDCRLASRMDGTFLPALQQFAAAVKHRLTGSRSVAHTRNKSQEPQTSHGTDSF